MTTSLAFILLVSLGVTHGATENYKVNHFETSDRHGPVDLKVTQNSNAALSNTGSIQDDHQIRLLNVQRDNMVNENTLHDSKLVLKKDNQVRTSQHQTTNRLYSHPMEGSQETVVQENALNKNQRIVQLHNISPSVVPVHQEPIYNAGHYSGVSSRPRQFSNAPRYSDVSGNQQQGYNNGRYSDVSGNQQQDYSNGRYSDVSRNQHQGHSNGLYSGVSGPQQQSYGNGRLAEVAVTQQQETDGRRYSIAQDQGGPHGMSGPQQSAFDIRGHSGVQHYGSQSLQSVPVAIPVTGRNVDNFPLLPAVVYNSGAPPETRAITYGRDSWYQGGASVRQHLQTPYVRYVYTHLL